MHTKVCRWGLATSLAVVAGCGRGDRNTSTPLEQGRVYTAWLYQNQYQKLWDRFSPEMRQTFGSATDLASFAGRAVQRLGVERGAVDEQVAEDKPFQVYSRTASFDRAHDRVLIQWSLGDDGQVAGFVVRPVPR